MKLADYILREKVFDTLEVKEFTKATKALMEKLGIKDLVIEVIGMTKCSQGKCDKDSTVQFDHGGKLHHSCDEHWEAYKIIMDAMGSPIPVCYTEGTETK